MKIVVYSTMNCPDTVEALKEYEAHGINFLFRDIDSSTKIMKEFLSSATQKKFLHLCAKITPWVFPASLNWTKL